MRNPKAKVVDPNKFETCPGSPIHILYSSKVLPTGEISLVECGTENIQDLIQSQAEFCDINYIMSRLELGDTSVLRPAGAYGDFTKAPGSLAEALQLIIDGESVFNALPLDTRQKFDNSYYQWLMSSGSDSWYEKMDLAPVSRVEDGTAALDQVSEVVNNES